MYTDMKNEKKIYILCSKQKDFGEMFNAKY